MDPELVALLTDTVQHAPYLGQDNYGKPSYGPPVPRKARIEWRTQLQAVGGAAQVVSETLVYMDANFTIDERDKITLADGSAPAIQTIERWSDEYGHPDYVRLHL